MCHYKREQKKPEKTKKQKNKKTKKKQKRSKPLKAVLEEVVKISGIIFESHQQGIKSLFKDLLDS